MPCGTYTAVEKGPKKKHFTILYLIYISTKYFWILSENEFFRMSTKCNIRKYVLLKYNILIFLFCKKVIVSSDLTEMYSYP